jgi:tetratricopeptide (TPR) repeat protein
LKDEYVAANDTGNVIKTYQEMLRVAPTNQQLRDQAFRVFLQMGKPEAAKVVAEEGLAIDPSNAELWDLKSNACLFLEDFTCAVDALEQAFSVDSARADSLFYNKISVAATQRPDTARLLKWAQRGSKKYPNSATMLDHLVTAYSYAGPVDSSISAVKRLYAVDSSDMRPASRWCSSSRRKNGGRTSTHGRLRRTPRRRRNEAELRLLLVNGALAKLQQPDNQDLEGSAEMARKAVALSVPADGSRSMRTTSWAWRPCCSCPSSTSRSWTRSRARWRRSPRSSGTRRRTRSPSARPPSRTPTRGAVPADRDRLQAANRVPDQGVLQYDAKAHRRSDVCRYASVRPCALPERVQAD